MILRTLIATSLTAAALLALPGCAVTRDQESVGAYIDDSAITSSVKTRFVDSRAVDANAISVETMKGTVMLSGFAKSDAEKAAAEDIARKVKGVVAVTNKIEVKP